MLGWMALTRGPQPVLTGVSARARLTSTLASLPSRGSGDGPSKASTSPRTMVLRSARTADFAGWRAALSGTHTRSAARSSVTRCRPAKDRCSAPTQDGGQAGQACCRHLSVVGSCAGGSSSEAMQDNGQHALPLLAVLACCQGARSCTGHNHDALPACLQQGAALWQCLAAGARSPEQSQGRDLHAQSPAAPALLGSCPPLSKPAAASGGQWGQH